jgi:hypothetical protein
VPWKPDYCTIDELKAALRVGDTQDDTEMRLAIPAASRAIDHATNRQFGKTDAVETRTFRAEWIGAEGFWRTRRLDDIQTTDGLVVTINGQATTDFELAPEDADVRGEPWTVMHTRAATPPTFGVSRYTIQVTATFGWTDIPVPVANACVLQAQRFFKRKDAPFGIAGSPDAGSEMRLLAKVDPDVHVMLVPFRRDWPMT